jgi:hypothetical protein
VLLLELGHHFVLVMEVAQAGVVFKMGLQVGWSSWRTQVWGSSWGVQVGVCRSSVVNSRFPSFDGVSLPTTSR